MASQGLTGIKFTGYVLKKQDPQQRGRYYVHIPQLQEYMPTTEGILCPNAIHKGHITNSQNSHYGQNTPLQPGTEVRIEFATDDINSARIIDIVSDAKPKSDMSAGKLLGVEPAGKIFAR